MNLENLVTNWGGFERLVAQLNETGDVRVEHNVVLTGRSGATRQIDVLIRHKQGLYEHLVVAECKYWNSPVERADVDELSVMVREVGASRGVIFSTKGFQSGAVTQAKHDAIDLFVVRELTDKEWGSPGRVVDVFLQIVQISIGKVVTDGAAAIGAVALGCPVTINLEFGPEGPVSATPTLTRDGLSLGPPLEQYIFDAAHQSARSLKTFTLNGGETCTRYLRRPTNLLPDVPFKVPKGDGLLIIPRVSMEVGIKITQSRITVDRAERYLFALAVENCVNGVVSAASRVKTAFNTIIDEIVPTPAPPDGEVPLQNGSIIRVILSAPFLFEEMSGLNPGPHLDL